MPNSIKAMLKKNKMSQVKLADLTKLDASYLNRVIQGKHEEISNMNAMKIANALNCQVEDIFG